MEGALRTEPREMPKMRRRSAVVKRPLPWAMLFEIEIESAALMSWNLGDSVDRLCNTPIQSDSPGQAPRHYQWGRRT